jgi:hypothetical protein
MGREVLKRKSVSRSSRHWREEGGLTVLEESSIDEDWSWITNSWIVIDGHRRRRYEYGMRIYGERDLADLMRDAGFTGFTSFGAWSGAPYDENANLLLMMAERTSDTDMYRRKAEDGG